MKVTRKWICWIAVEKFYYILAWPGQHGKTDIQSFLNISQYPVHQPSQSWLDNDKPSTAILLMLLNLCNKRVIVNCIIIGHFLVKSIGKSGRYAINGKRWQWLQRHCVRHLIWVHSQPVVVWSLVGDAGTRVYGKAELLFESQLRKNYFFIC